MTAQWIVLILVLMENTLGVEPCTINAENPDVCLNPCSNGRYSRRVEFKKNRILEEEVLILVLMEDTLGVV